MKPRIVRESEHGPGCGLYEAFNGPAYLALPWPPECPYTPEQVMAACERDGDELAGVPYKAVIDDAWTVDVSPYRACTLTPEFIGEPRCEHLHGTGIMSSTGVSVYSICDNCGTILSDRRYYTQRKGERRNQVRRGFDPKVGTGRRTADRRSS